MAINKKLDDPKKNSASHKLSHSVPVIFFKEWLNSLGDGFQATDAENFANFPASLAVVMGAGFFAFSHMPFVDSEVTVLPAVDETYSFQEALDENGYIVVSSDNGFTGHALFREGDIYRLYSFDQRHKINDQVVLHLEDEKVDSWYLARNLSQDFSSLAIATVDVDAAFDAPKWEVYSFDIVSEFVQEENGSVRRYAGNLVSQDETYESMTEQFETVGQAWKEAAIAINAGRTGMSDEYIAAHQGEYTTGISDFSEEEIADEAGLIALLGGSLLLGATAIPGTVRRRRSYFDSKKGLKP